MKLATFAATGGTGRHVLEQAVDAGHDVTAVVRSPEKLSRPVRAVAADLAAPDPAVLEAAVAGSDAVLSGLGPRSRAEAGITSKATQAIVDAMKATGVRRIVVVSVAGIMFFPSPAVRTRGATRVQASSCITCSAGWPGACSPSTTPTSH